jgi:hypothetical protein
MGDNGHSVREDFCEPRGSAEKVVVLRPVKTVVGVSAGLVCKFVEREWIQNRERAQHIGVEDCK